MKIGLRSSKFLLGPMLVAVAACSLPVTMTQEDGPTVVLTAEDPVAEFSVTLCMDTPDIDYVTAWATLRADARRVEGAEPVTVIGGVDGESPEDRAELLDAEPVDSAIEADLAAEGAWEGQSGRRCSEPEIVRFELEDGADEARVELEWSVTFGAEYDDWLHGGDGIDEEDLTVEIEAIE